MANRTVLVMARITTVAVTLWVLAATLISPAAAGALRGSPARTDGPVRVPLGAVEVRGLVHHEGSDRLVVAVDDQVEIFDLGGRPTATVDGVPGAMAPVEAGGFVVVGSPPARELVVIDPVAGTVVDRIRTGVRGLSALAATGDRVWYANAQWPDGIGVASIAEATAEPAQDLGRLDVADDVQIEVSPARPGRVYLTDPSTGGLRWADRDGGRARTGPAESVTSFVVAERGDVVWAVTAAGGIVELDAETLGSTGFRFEAPDAPEPSGTGPGPGLMAGHGDERLAVATGRTVTLYDVGDPLPEAVRTFAGRVTAIDLTGDELVVVLAEDRRSDDGPLSAVGTPPAAELLVLGDDDAPPRPVLELGFFGLGDPSTGARGAVQLSCAGLVAVVPIRYGSGLQLPLPADTTTCQLTIRGGPTPPDRRLIIATGAGRTDPEAGIRIGSAPRAGGDAGGADRSPTEPITVPISGIAGNDRVDLVDRYPSAVSDPAVLTGQIFDDLLGRAPTTAERRSWSAALATGATPGELTVGLLATPDFQAQIAPISRLYLAYFGRRADEAGLAYWLTRVRSGTSIEEVSWAFGASTEFGGGYGAIGSDPRFVELLYRRVLGRAAEPEGAAYWTGALAGGASRSHIMTTFAESPEFARRSDPGIAVRWLHRGLLGRDPDPAAGLYWRAMAQTGGSLTGLVDDILASPEFEQRFWLRDPLHTVDAVGFAGGAGPARLEARPSPAWRGPEIPASDPR